MNQPKNSFTQKPVSCEACSLHHICLPKGLSNVELNELEFLIDKSIKLKKKEPLFKSKQEMEGIYAVKSGAIKTSISNVDGQEQVLAFHLPGDILGFDAFNTGTHTCNAIAIEDALLCKISMEAFDDLCDRLPGMRKEFIHQVGKEISHSQNQLLALGQQHTDERLAVFLLTLSNHYQSRGFSNKEFLLPMSRQDLSNYLGMAVETLSRIITKLTTNGVIKVNHRMVLIKDQNKLEHLAHVSCGKS